MIHKQFLGGFEYQTVMMPEGSTILNVGIQNDMFCVWYSFNETEEVKFSPRNITIEFTGDSQFPQKNTGKYINTLTLNGIVCHFFENEY